MAGARREITDPVEAATHDIGSSRRLIAATLDDLSAHHSWLETYHRAERLRAERLRRRELRERLERLCQRTATRAKRAAQTSYVGGRRVARFSKRHALAFTHWISPRLRKLARHAAETSSTAWAWSRQHTPVFAHQAYAAARDGFTWSVRTSEEKGYVFRQRASEAFDEAIDEFWRSTAPSRRRGSAEWARTRLRTRRARIAAGQRLAEAAATSDVLAQVRKRFHRWTVRAFQIGAPLVRRAHATALRVEDELSARVIRIAPEIRRLLQAHMPGADAEAQPAAARPGRALILRPTTALACIAPAEHKLPVPYRA